MLAAGSGHRRRPVVSVARGEVGASAAVAPMPGVYNLRLFGPDARSTGMTGMDWLISSAAAQATGAPGQGNVFMQLLPLLLIFVVFYFLLIRPQTKRAKEHREMVARLGVGDEVVTSGGILGRIIEVAEQFLTVEIAEKVQVKVQRHTISQVLPKGTIKSA